MNRYLMFRVVAECLLGGAVLFALSILETGYDQEWRLLGGMILVSIMFQISGLFLLSSFIFERWNYTGNIFWKSVLISLIFLGHYSTANLFVRPLHAPWAIITAGGLGAVTVFLLNYIVRPARGNK